MGLDMYLERINRYKDATIDDVRAVESYIRWGKEKESGGKYANCTFKEWCGRKETPRKDIIEYYSKFMDNKYYAFDYDHTMPKEMIVDNVGYWRKANEIHNWFVENVQCGKDDCGSYKVDKQMLLDLLDVCEIVLYNPDNAEELLPTRSGFFFGSTDYDEWYFHDIKYTIETIKNVIKETDFDTQDIYYSSSW